jgi:hypothetical protein
MTGTLPIIQRSASTDGAWENVATESEDRLIRKALKELLDRISHETVG